MDVLKEIARFEEESAPEQLANTIEDVMSTLKKTSFDDDVFQEFEKLVGGYSFGDFQKAINILRSKGIQVSITF